MESQAARVHHKNQEEPQRTGADLGTGVGRTKMAAGRRGPRASGGQRADGGRRTAWISLANSVAELGFGAPRRMAWRIRVEHLGAKEEEAHGAVDLLAQRRKKHTARRPAELLDADLGGSARVPDGAPRRGGRKGGAGELGVGAGVGAAREHVSGDGDGGEKIRQPFRVVTETTMDLEKYAKEMGFYIAND